MSTDEATPTRPHTTCVLCTVPRSGSWLLSDLVDQTDLVGHPEEYFRPDYRRQWSSEWGIPVTGPYSRYVEAALTNTSTDNGVFSVKLHWYQLEWFVARLRELPESDVTADDATLLAQWLPDPRYVHLYREDTARQAVSHYRASFSDVWFILDEADPDASLHNPGTAPKLPSEPDLGQIRWFEDLVARHERNWKAFFARYGISPLEIRYEDLVQAFQPTVRRILEHCGLDVPDDLALPVPRLRKQANEESERWVQAYLAVRDTIEARPYRRPVVPRPLPAGES
jgi:LPS sulfotransferase NodH